MNLNISYDSTTLSAAPAAFFSAVNYVVGLFDAIFTNNVTVAIEVGYGTFPLDGSMVPPLGESEQNNLVFGNYAQVRQSLLNEGAPGATTLPVTSPLSGGLVLGSAQARALGISAPSGLDGWVGIASDATLSQQLFGASWSYSVGATPGGNQYYLVGVLEHEITEVMGRTSYLDVGGEYSVMDLYRYKASGLRQTGIGSPAYFSTNGGATNLDNWNTQLSGDIGDWAASAGADAFLAFNPAGQINRLTATDQTLMSAIGWTTRTYFAPGLPANVVYTTSGSNLPAAFAGQFNLELFNNGTGSGSAATASGYQGIALVSSDGRTVSLLHGDYGLVDTAGNGGNNLIVLGDGSESIGGAIGDTILGGSGPSQFLDGHAGYQSITGGSGGNETIWGAATDIITGGSGGNETIGGVPGETILGGAANTLIDASQGSQWIALRRGNATVWGGAHDTILGARATGSAQIGFAGGSETLWDNGVSTNGRDTVTDFNQAAGDRVSLNGATDTVIAVLASATSDLGGNVVLHLHDNSSITLVGVSIAMLNTGFFTTH